MSKKEVSLLAAKILGIPIEKAEQYNKQVNDAGTAYYWNPARGGAAVIIDEETGEFLYAVSAVNFSDHVAMFSEGKRTGPNFLKEIEEKKTSLAQDSSNTPAADSAEPVKTDAAMSEKQEQQSNASDTVEIAQPKSQQESENTAILEEKLANALKAITALQESFDDKIAEDQHKNQLFDNMHRELTKYQNGLLDKVINTMAMDIIQFVDSVRKSLGIYKEKEPTEENYGKLLKVVSGVAEDLDDILYRQSIEPYTVPGDDVDARRQKIIQTVETDDETKDNKIAVRVAPGYEKDGKILRQEIIKIFKFKSENNNNKGE